MKITFIATVLNEKGSISDFLKSIFHQSTMPDEIIIVDGGSTDATKSVISSLIRSASLRLRDSDSRSSGQISNKKIRFKFIVKKGNRSVGRNEAIKKARNEIILCSDAGCILDKNWVKNITEPFNDPKIDVVAGYYKGKPKSVFEKCLIPYVLVMKDKINSNNFLPASRSMAFRKSIWKKTGGFPEEFNNNEDYVFAKRLEKINANIVFEKKAIVYWMPRSNVKDAFIMFYRFAKGDSESRIFRPKVVLIFTRYAIGILLILLFLVFKSYIILNTLYLILFFYIILSIAKNYRYIRNWKAIFYLPLIQLISDIAVTLGTQIGIYRLVFHSKNKT